MKKKLSWRESEIAVKNLIPNSKLEHRNRSKGTSHVDVITENDVIEVKHTSSNVWRIPRHSMINLINRAADMGKRAKLVLVYDYDDLGVKEIWVLDVVNVSRL